MNKHKLHIALVSNTSWSIYNFRLGLVRALLASGHYVYTIAPRDEYSDKLTAAGATYIPLKMEAYSTSPLKAFASFYHLLSIYRKHKFDRILHYTIKANIFGSIAAKLSGLNSIAVITGLGRTFQFKGITQSVIRLLYKISIRCSNEIWFLNTNDRSKFISEGLVTANKTFILPSEGVNTSKFRGIPLSQVDHKVKRIIFAGRLLKDKGILEFVDAAKIISQTHNHVKFEIIGFVHPDNPMSVSLSDIEEWQRRGWINYLGSHEDIRPFINRADCLVFPSYYPEGISRILLESASMSRPIITTDQVGCREVVDHNQNGFLVPPRSVPDLVDAINLLLSISVEDLELMGALGRKKVQDLFDEQIIIDIYFEKLFSSENSIPLLGERKRQINKH